MPQTPTLRPHPHKAKSVDPTLTRKGFFSHPGTLILAGTAVLFTMYALDFAGVQKPVDEFFRDIDSHAQSAGSGVPTVVLSLAPIALGLMALVGLWMCWRWIGRARKNRIKAKLLRGRVPMSQDEFVAMAAGHGVSEKVAQKTYRFLDPHESFALRVKAEDRLREDLHVSGVKVLDAMVNLLKRCDRKKSLGTDAEDVRTVLDLMLYVEKAPSQFLTDEQMRMKVGAKCDLPQVERQAAVGETRMVVPLHKRSKAMETIRRMSGMRKAADVEGPRPGK